MAGYIEFRAQHIGPRGGTNDIRFRLTQVARARLIEAAERCGEAAIENVAANASSRFQTSNRGRSAPLSDPSNYGYDVVSRGGGREGGVTLEFRLQNGDPQFRGKWGSANFGRGGGYIIEPRGAAQLGNKEDGFIVGKGSNVAGGAQSGTRFYDDGISEAVDAFKQFL